LNDDGSKKDLATNDSPNRKLISILKGTLNLIRLQKSLKPVKLKNFYQ
jgi:hypothetical protein